MKNILNAACEALDSRTVNSNNNRETKKTAWFCSVVKQKRKEKKQAYLKYRTARTPESYAEYKRIRNETITLVTQVKY